MGNSTSSGQCTRMWEDSGGLNGSSTAKIIHLEGNELQEFRLPTKAGRVLSQNPNCFLCGSDSMQIDSSLPHMKEDEELQMDQIYFLMPLRNSQAPVSLPELCVMAIKASSLLGYYSPKTPLDYSDRNGAICCRIPIRLRLPECISVTKGSRKLSGKSQNS